MSRISPLLPATALLLATILLASALPAPVAAETQDAKQGTRTLEELRLAAYATLDGEESTFYISGYAYAFIPGQRPSRIFGLEGYNVRRYVPVEGTEGDLILASREILFYTDPSTGEAIEEWDNPMTGERVEVFHIQNDPVNFRFNKKGDQYFGATLDGSREFGPGAPPVDWTDNYIWYADVFPYYPLPGWEKNYTAAEMFDFYVPKSGATTDGPFETLVSWTRVGPWLPWLKMDGHEGLMVYHARSRRLGDWEELPDWIRTRVLEQHPEYRHAPESVDQKIRNETSWSFYMKEMKRREAASQ